MVKKMEKIEMKNKAQHEIAGFVLIVLLVSIIGVVFLSITLGNPEVSRQTSVEVSNLLLSSMYYTTDCAINYVPQYREIQDLIKECYKDQSRNLRKCLDERGVCSVLEENLKNILDKSLNIEEGRVNKAYNLNIYYSDDENPNEEIISFEKGVFSNCTSVVGGSHPIPSGSFESGEIETELLVCKS